MIELSNTAIKRIMKKARAERISITVITSLAEILGYIGIKISKEAIDLVKHAKRKTVEKKISN